MKLGPDMYHLHTFHLQENEGGSEWAGGGVYSKNHQKMSSNYQNANFNIK